MKRINLFRFGLMIASLLFFSVTYGTTVHNITQNTHFSSIQAAINDPSTLANDIIIIDSGTYNERVIIDKPLTLEGVDSAQVILSGSGLVGNGNGITINSGVTNVTIKKLTVMNYAGASGNTHAGIRAVGGNNNLLIDQVRIQDNVGTSTGGSGFYANGPVNGVTITNVTSTGHIYGARGIVIWNGLKENINISNNHVYGNNCCGIELQDGSASGVTMNNNYVHDNGDNGMSAVGLEGPGVNVLSGNTLSNNGRFGIEIKNPNGSGSSSGAGSIVISNNSVSRTAPIVDARDIVGIAVFRRSVLAGNVDVPTGVQVNNNIVSGYVQTSTSDGFGIVLEGVNHTAVANTLIGNDVGIQRQAGHLPYPGDGNQNNLADQYFGRGNAPISCGITISGSTYTTNGIDTRDVGSASGTGIVVNTNTGKSYCSIQAAIDDPLTLAGQVLQVSAGTFTEDVNITKAIDLRGSNYGVSCNGSRGSESIITASTTTSGSKAITISSDGVSIDGFTITNPTGSFGIYAKGRSNTTITNNIISDLGNATSGSGATYGVAIEMGATANISNVNISDNCVSNLRGGQNTSLTGSAAKSNNGSAVGIGFGFSTANYDISSGVISGNTISNITANALPFSDGGKGAYGVLINVGANSAHNGKATGALVSNNEISVLSGLWSHGIGLEGETPGAQVLNNKVDNLSSTKTPVDALGVLLEDNAGSGTVSIHENSFTNLAFGIVNLMIPSADATCNWYGPSLLDTSFGALLTVPYLTNGTDGNTAIGFQPIPGSCSGGTSVHNITQNTHFSSIQSAIDDASTVANDIIVVDVGTFTEDVNITKAIDLRGSNYGVSCNGSRGSESIITASTTTSGSKAITISSDGVSVDGFTITNPTGSFGIYAKGRSNTTITNNIISDLGNATSGSGATYGVAIEMGATANISNVNISDNCVSNLRGGQNTSLTGSAAKSNNGSAVGIGFGFSTANYDISSGVISGNTISNITANALPFSDGGKGAYGVLINVGANSAHNGKATGALVSNNEISVLSGLWSHGIGLEGETPGAQVLNNKVDNLSSTKTPVDALGVLLEDNAGSGTVSIHENSFTNLAFGIVNLMIPSADATCNWYGPSLLDSSFGALLTVPYLTNGTDGNTAIGFQPISGSCSGGTSVHNITQNTHFSSIQSAIDDASTVANDIIVVAAGTFTEDVNITKAIDLRGSNYGVSCNGSRGSESIITASTTTSGSKAITISSDGVSIDGFTITNPTGSFGIYAKGRSNTTITNNIISDLGNATSGSGATYGVAIEMGATANISNVNISDNCVSNLRGGQNTSLTGSAAKSNNGSAVGIGFGFSTANYDISSGVISGNTISNITANALPFSDGGKGAYGVLINVGANSAHNGKATGALVSNNEISVLSGLWSHGIGLEGETPGAQVLNNKVDNLSSTKTPVDALGVLLEDNAGSGTVSIHENSFTNLAFGIVNLMIPSADATCNWYGPSLLDTSFGALVTIPYLTDGTDGSSAIGFQLNAGQVCGACTTTITYSGTADVCLNTTKVFTGSGTPATTNAWVSSDPLIASVDNAGVITGLANGTVTITYTEDNGCSATQVVNVIPTTSNTIVVTACNSYTSPSSNYTWTTSGIYQDTLTNANGCDSVLTIDLTINNSNSNSISVTACNSYTSPSSNYTWTTSGVYQDTLTNSNGCDSVLTITLTINTSTSNSITETACYSYTSPSMNYTWTTSGVYQDTLTSANGCDSVLTINLTIYDSTSNTINILNCPSDINKTCVGGSGKKVYWNDPSATLSNPCIPTCVGGTSIPGFDYKGTHNGHSYYVSTSSNYKWTEARDAAIAAGGYLVSINNAAENSFVRSIIPSYCYKGRVWIGYNDVATEGTFEWVNGDMTSYTNWKQGEPNNQGPGYCGYGWQNNQVDYAIMKKKNGRWFDRKNCEKNNFVMEIPCSNPVTVVQVAGPPSGSTFAGASTTQITYLAYTAAGDSAYCNFDVIVSECTPAYCAPPNYKSNYEYIDRVELGAIDNISGNDGGYGNYVSQSTSLSQGTTIPITLTPGFTNNTYHEYWKVWIDWNYDGDFKDYGEKVAHGHSSNPIVKNIQVPNSATLNKPLRMRVIMKWGGYPKNACGQYCYGWGNRWGEVEDYSVVVIPGSNKMAITKIITKDIDPMYQNPIDLTSLYPNPIRSGENEITLQYRVLKDGPVNVSVQSIDGKILSRQVLNGMEGENRMPITLPPLSAGVYTVIIANADGRTMKKFSVK